MRARRELPLPSDACLPRDTAAAAEGSARPRPGASAQSLPLHRISAAFGSRRQWTCGAWKADVAPALPLLERERLSTEPMPRAGRASAGSAGGGWHSQKQAWPRHHVITSSWCDGAS